MTDIAGKPHNGLRFQPTKGKMWLGECDQGVLTEARPNINKKNIRKAGNLDNIYCFLLLDYDIIKLYFFNTLAYHFVTFITRGY